MAFKTRSELNGLFSQGKRPTAQNFKDWQDAYYHKDEDPIKVTGWTLRSFFKDVRAEGATSITTGGTSIIEIPATAKRLRSIRLVGRGTGSPAPFTISASLAYFSDVNIPSLNGAATGGNPLPPGFFFHPLLGAPAPVTFSFTSSQFFDKSFDFNAVPMTVDLNFMAIRFFRLIIGITSGSFPNSGADPSYVYYGLEFE